MASTCADLGCRVTVLEALDIPLRNVLGPMIGSHFASLHAAHGVDLRTGVGVAGVRRAVGATSGLEVELDGGEVLPADVVVVGIGVVPATEWLADSGLTIDNGVVCDDRLFAAAGVVAAGDMARWKWRHDGGEELIRIEHWQVAAEAGVAAARSLLAGRADASRSLRFRTSGPISTASACRCWGAPAVGTTSRSSTDRSGRGSSSPSSAEPVACAPSMAIGRPRQLMGFRPLLESGSSWDDALAHEVS